MEYDDILGLEEDEFSTSHHARQLTRFPASHHTSPLTYYPQRHVVDLMSGVGDVRGTVLLRAFVAAINDVNLRLGGGYSAIIQPESVYHFYFSLTCEDGQIFPDNDPIVNGLLDCVTVSLDELKGDLQAIGSAHSVLSELYRGTDYSQPEIENVCSLVAKSFKARRHLEHVRNTVQKNHMERNESIVEVRRIRHFRVFCVKELIMFASTSDRRTITLLNYDQILMLLDTVSCRFMTRLTLEISSLRSYDNLPTWEKIREIYTWGDELIREYGMAAFATIGEFESIVTGVFVSFQDTDPLRLGDSFLESISLSTIETEQEHGINRSHVLALIHTLRSVGSVNWLSEIFGLRKHWGNPMVDAKASGRAVQEKMDEILPVNGSALVRLLASFNRMVVMEYISQHGKWPEGMFPEQCGVCPIKQAFLSKVTRVPETSIDHRHEHWALFRFLPNCILDSYVNDLVLLSDKSVSPYKPHLDAVYVRSLCSVQVPSEIPENRRLLLEYIRKQHLSILDIFKVVMTKTIPDEWLANCASMKGTEMKHLKARIFAVFTYELRQYFAASEDLIKNHLFRYNPHQTMTLSESELLKKLEVVTRQLDVNCESRVLSVMHIIDFSKWNLRMRYSNTCLVFKSIDDFLGTPGLIEQTHCVFSDVVNVVQDAFNPPPHGVHETESDTIWRNHSCGWEGQRQKGWTILTSALLSDLARVTGVSSTICGQGDNQTLLAQFPIPDCYRNPSDWISRDPEGVRHTLDQYYQRLDEECAAIGLKIKTAESCRSLCYFNYGKRLYFNGVELSMTLKRLSKNVTEPNDSYPSSESLLKTLEGSAFAAGLYSHPSLLPYLVGRVAFSLQLSSCFNQNQLAPAECGMLLGRRALRFNRRFLSILMKIPPSLGGPPQLMLPSYLFRGHPDPLCSELVMVVLRARHGCTVSRKIVTCALSGVWFREERQDRTSLIVAPYSLNLDIPLSCRVPLEREIVPALRGCCHNDVVKGMFAMSMDRYDTSLMESLSCMTPFQPLVANDLYSRSLPGRRKSFISGLANTTSLGRLLYENHQNPMIYRIRALEIAQLESWIGRVLTVRAADASQFNPISHHVLAEQLRILSWGVNVVGVTVPHPLEQFKLSLSVHDTCAEECRTAEEEHLVMVRHNEGLISVPGEDSGQITAKRSKQGSPYLGSSVTEGIIQRQVVCTNPDESWRDVIRLNTIRKWVTRESSQLDNLIRSLIQTRTDVPMTTIDDSTGIPSRLSYNHRASLMAVVNTCGVSTTTNMHTRLYVSSNQMGRYSHGDRNYHMPFGPTFLCYQSLICLLGVYCDGSWRNSQRSVYHVHVRSADVPEVYDGDLDLSSPMRGLPSQLTIPSIVFASSSELSFETQSGYVLGSLWGDYDRAPLRDARFGYAFQLIADAFVRETVVRESMTHDRWTGHAPRSSPVSIGDVGLVSLQTLIQALAWNFLLLSPLSLWALDTRDSFCVRATGFLNCFSTGFWSQFTGPISNERLSRLLLTQYTVVMNTNLTRSSSGLREPLLNAVVLEMWSLFTRILLAVQTEDTWSPVNIYVPSFQSLKLMFSKYVEMIVYVSLCHGSASERQAFDFSRDFATNALSVEATSLQSMISTIHRDFRELIIHLESVPRYLPKIQFYSLQHPWVDKLRSSVPIRALPVDEQEVEYPTQYPNLQDSVEFNIPDRPTLIRTDGCQCGPVERKSLLHTECFFGLTGPMSKSHMKFLDIVLALRLDVRGVVVLGSSTGSEAYSFAKITVCRKVYVNCHLPINNFTPHMAGSYVPTMFASGHFRGKLVNPASAALSSSDLLLEETIQAILTHIQGEVFTGITCDAEFPHSQSDAELLDLLRNINLLARSVLSVQWVIVKVPFVCTHSLPRFINLVSENFSIVTVTSSPFSRPGMPVVYLVGRARRTVPRVETSSEYLPTICLNSGELDLLVAGVISSRICKMFYVPRVIRHQRMQVAHFSRSSFVEACSRFIPGWYPQSLMQISRERIRSSINDVRRALYSQAEDALRVASRTFSDRNQPRNTILQLAAGPLHRNLNNVYKAVNRCDLLLALTSDETFDVVRASRTILDWISTSHEYRLRTRSFMVDLNPTQFISISSRFLFEILGHVYQGEAATIAAHQDLGLFHRHPTITEFNLLEDLFSPLNKQWHRQPCVITWRWKRRALILFILLSHHIAQTPIKLRNIDNSILVELNIAERFDFIRSSNDITPCVTVAHVSKLSELFDLIPVLESIAFLLIPVRLCSVICEIFGDVTYYKCPWSGLVPETVIARCALLDERTGRGPVFPCFDNVINVTNSAGLRFLDCPCFDCSVEQVLCEVYTITHRELDRLCSLNRIESVLDTSHAM